MSGNPYRLREIGEPEREIHQWISVLEKRATSRLCFAEPPSLLTRAELVMPRPHAEDSAQLTALKKAAELLHIAAESMVVSDDDHSFGLLRGGEDAIHTGRSQ